MDHATEKDLRVGDIIEILDRPVYQVDPGTRMARTTLQRFRVTSTDSGQKMASRHQRDTSNILNNA